MESAEKSDAELPWVQTKETAQEVEAASNAQTVQREMDTQKSENIVTTDGG